MENAMTTTRERLEYKANRRIEWAHKAEARAARHFAAADRIASNIPFGQPILVGHHSERHARADQRRIHSNMDKACEESALAKHHESKANGLEHMLDRCVFSDDENAISALETRIADRRAKVDYMKRVNGLYRKGDASALAGMGLDLETLRAKVAAVGYSWVKAPFESYQLSNLGALIRTDEKRIQEIKVRSERQAKAEASGGVTFEHGNEATRVTFSEKPDRDVLNALREAGYRWGGGSWTGRTDALPACLKQT